MYVCHCISTFENLTNSQEFLFEHSSSGINCNYVLFLFRAMKNKSVTEAQTYGVSTRVARKRRVQKGHMVIDVTKEARSLCRRKSLVECKSKSPSLNFSLLAINNEARETGEVLCCDDRQTDRHHTD